MTIDTDDETCHAMDMNVYTNVLGAIERRCGARTGAPSGPDQPQICFSVHMIKNVHIPLLDYLSMVESVKVTVSNVIMSREFGGAWAFRSNDSHPRHKAF
jgi:hypothetical protein